eukprot:1721371-Rhodomonas_salina.1
MSGTDAVHVVGTRSCPSPRRGLRSSGRDRLILSARSTLSRVVTALSSRYRGCVTLPRAWDRRGHGIVVPFLAAGRYVLVTSRRLLRRKGTLLCWSRRTSH